ncbi:MAG: hypothetical protein L6Q37_01605 [Bdellovibrionaceae bacterium]|jgi:hypothetical protein|nr:hypothetical protein [Pseudobdellovibrionaceae bacterium]NUM59109.1 hypothetical protein [Pseudobdellovibrionaceae bacterium]
MSFKKRIIAITLCFTLILPKPAKADLFGGDVAVLVQILAQTIKQLYELQRIVSTGQDTLSLMRDINRGIRDGLAIIRIVNPKFNPGLYGGLETIDQVQRAIEDLYGAIPQTSEYRLQEAQDKSVSESIAMNGTLFQYADSVDEETKRIIAHAQKVSPQGAGKLTAESLAVLIGVTTQVLRTNSMMLKMMGQNMALSNRKEKLQATQFKAQYEGISNALGTLPKETKLSPMNSSTGR